VRYLALYVRDSDQLQPCHHYEKKLMLGRRTTPQRQEDWTKVLEKVKTPQGWANPSLPLEKKVKRRILVRKERCE
jgi:hypothetical protein